jgi:hypothetical protein
MNHNLKDPLIKGQPLQAPPTDLPIGGACPWRRL